MSAIRRDVADYRAWVARAVVLFFAALAGLAVVGFTWLSEHALQLFAALSQRWAWAPLLLSPLVTAAIVWATLRFAPGAAGSGIPQVMAALEPEVDERRRPLFVSLRLSLAKVLLTTAGLFGGLAIGREGPAVQVAAGILLQARRWLPSGSNVHVHGLLVAGGAAGIAAAFNAPLAGVVFAIEELSRRLEQRSSGLLLAAIVLAGLMAVSISGNATYFGVIRVPDLSPALLLPGAAVVLCCGLLGGLFARLLHLSLTGGGPARVAAFRHRHPVVFAAGCGLAIGLLGLASGGLSYGSGYDHTRGLLEGRTDVPVLYVGYRFVATWLAAWSGAPGGIFAPSLAIGAGVGHDIAGLAGVSTAAPVLIALGMAAFLAAVTQAPLTSFIIVMEMVDGHAMVLSLMAATLSASAVSRWISRPLYPALAEAQLGRLAERR